MRVNVVIVAFNAAPWMQRCLASLRTSELIAHVIVVDNGSTDDTRAIVAQDFPEVELLVLGRNLGFGQGNNVGIARAMALGAEYIFLLNQDAYVLPDLIGKLAAFMDQHPEFGVASPLHCSPDDQTIDAKTYAYYLRNDAEHWLCDAALGRAAKYYRIRGINAAAWFVRSSVFDQVGGFDPLFFMYGEDDDLIARFAHHEVRFALLTEARVVHLRESVRPPGVPTVWQDIDRRARRHRSALVVLIKRPNASVSHMALLLLSHGLIRPFADALIGRDLREFSSVLVASWRVLFEVPRIRRHARLCAANGRHFLQLGDSVQ